MTSAILVVNHWLRTQFTFEGRTRRRSYLASLACFSAPYTVAAITDHPALSLFILLIGAWPIVAFSVRRCHDRDRSGKFLLFVAVPFAAFALIAVAFITGHIGDFRTKILGGAAVILLGLFEFWVFGEFLFVRGTQGANRFGPDPRLAQPQSVF